MQLYTDENQDTFPAHRNQNLNTADEPPSRTNWWGTTIVGYGAPGQSNLFHDPAIKGKRLDDGTTLDLEVRLSLVGYGYNGWFLGHHPYGARGSDRGGIRFHVDEFIQTQQRPGSFG